MRGMLPAIMLSLMVAGCVTASAPTSITREEMAASVTCSELPAGVDCNCVIDKAVEAYPKVPLTVLNENPSNAEQSQKITRMLRTGLARKQAVDACTKPAGAN